MKDGNIDAVALELQELHIGEQSERVWRYHGKCLFCKDEEPLPIAEGTMIDTGMFFFLHFNSAHKRKEEGRVELLRSYTRHNPSIGLKGAILL